MKVKHYRIGVELLDENKRPIEHIGYEEEKNFEFALMTYENFNIDDRSAKYLFAVTENDEEIELMSSGYSKLDPTRLEIMLYNAVLLLEEYMNLIPNSNRILDELGMTKEEYDELMGSEDYEF